MNLAPRVAFRIDDLDEWGGWEISNALSGRRSARNERAVRCRATNFGVRYIWNHLRRPCSYIFHVWAGRPRGWARILIARWAHLAQRFRTSLAGRSIVRPRGQPLARTGGGPGISITHCRGDTSLIRMGNISIAQIQIRRKMAYFSSNSNDQSPQESESHQSQENDQAAGGSRATFCERYGRTPRRRKPPRRKAGHPRRTHPARPKRRA